eukprot:4269772-Pyramimonas_sp.AAC.1
MCEAPSWRADQACTAGPEGRKEGEGGRVRKRNLSQESPDQEALANMTTLHNTGDLLSLPTDLERSPVTCMH